MDGRKEGMLALAKAKEKRTSPSAKHRLPLTLTPALASRVKHLDEGGGGL
jgi:hypothetical protein